MNRNVFHIRLAILACGVLSLYVYHQTQQFIDPMSAETATPILGIAALVLIHLVADLRRQIWATVYDTTLDQAFDSFDAQSRFTFTRDISFFVLGDAAVLVTMGLGYGHAWSLDVLLGIVLVACFLAGWQSEAWAHAIGDADTASTE